MAFTASQATIIAQAIRSHPAQAVINALSARNDVELANLLNGNSTFIVWRKNIQPEEYREALDWTEIDNLSVGKARVWEWVTQNMTAALDTSKNNIRQGLAGAFSGNTLSSLTTLAKRPATLCEAMFVTGVGTNGNPGNLDYSGKVSHSDVSQALNDNP